MLGVDLKVIVGRIWVDSQLMVFNANDTAFTRNGIEP